MKGVCVIAALALATAGPIVQIDQGKLEGRVYRNILSIPQYNAFYGIPYAKPPVGPHRFKPPLPPSPWNGTRNATKEGSICVQLSVSNGNANCGILKLLTLEPQLKSIYEHQCDFAANEGNEDCLFINVFTKELPVVSGFKLKPVMVWIHGGGFITGSGNSNIYGPAFLLEYDVVVVTFNYRLAAFGFMSLNNTEVSGNMGLKDQVMALKWVQGNIAQFGGDPNKVTIFGQSAGAVCVHAHLLSPLSKGLFRAAIAQSGTTLDPFGFGLGVYGYSRSLFENLGCNKSLNEVQCLQTASANTITNSSLQAVMPLVDSYTYEMPFTPTVEPWNATEAFLTDVPLNYYKKGRVTDVPFLTGVNNEEAYIMKPYIDSNPDYFEIWRQWPDTFIPKNLDPSKYNATVLMETIKQFYFGDREMSKATIRKYMNMITDIQWVNGDRETLKWHALVNKEATYSYQFAFSGLWNFGKFLAGAELWPGASHGDEIGYLFNTGVQVRNPLTYLTPTSITSRRMLKMWTNFAKTGNPTSDKDIGIFTPPLITWPPYTSDKHSCLRINYWLRILPQLEPRRSAFWDDIYRRYGYP